MNKIKYPIILAILIASNTYGQILQGLVSDQLHNLNQTKPTNAPTLQPASTKKTLGDSIKEQLYDISDNKATRGLTDEKFKKMQNEMDVTMFHPKITETFWYMFRTPGNFEENGLSYCINRVNDDFLIKQLSLIKINDLPDYIKLVNFGRMAGILPKFEHETLVTIKSIINDISPTRLNETYAWIFIYNLEGYCIASGNNIYVYNRDDLDMIRAKFKRTAAANGNNLTPELAEDVNKCIKESITPKGNLLPMF